MKPSKILLILLLAVIALASFRLWRQFSKPTVNFRPSSAAGEVLADEVARFLNDTGRVVVISRPPLSADLAAKLSGRSLKLVAVCGYGANVRHWLETRTLSAAVVPRLDAPPPASSAQKTVMDWFEREFQLLTSERPRVQSN